MNILIYDDGIGIPGSFKEADMNFNLHGRGLNSTARITTLGFKGEMLIFSGNGICLVTENGIDIRMNENSINGTFISLHINNKKIDNIYEYLKYVRINQIKGV